MFEPPGPGWWVLDVTHFSGPVTPFTRELFPDPVERGFQDGTRPYGVLLDRIAWGFVGPWPYLSTRPVPELEQNWPLTEREWERLVASSPGLTERLATAAAVFPARAWRRDLARWDGEVKPAAVSEHAELARVAPDGLSSGEVTAHLDHCLENLRRSLYRHHRFNVAAVIAVGDFLVHVERWTGRSGPEVLGLLRGSTPLYLGAEDELAAIVDALRRDPDALAVLDAGGDPGMVLDGLAGRPGATGAAAGRYLQRVGDWPVGSGADVADPRLIEVPEVLVRTIQAAVQEAPAVDAVAADAAADLRRSLAPEYRAPFDDLLVEAKDSYRLRDERATFCDVWAFGLMRRAILAAGRRLADAGRLTEPVHLLEARYVEMGDLLEGRGGTDGAELAERARDRAAAKLEDAPPFLGPPPRPPLPVEWLPPDAARTERAFRAYVAAMAGDEEPSAEDGGSADTESATVRLRGVGASPGRYDGTARLVHGADELSRVGDGDVLVARATSPAFNVVLPFVGAIVTDSGGLLSHAAIVAREYGIPAVVGTIDATRRIGDGARVRVDGDLGEVWALT